MDKGVRSGLNSFQLYLPSTGSSDLFPENRQSRFRIQLPHPIELQGTWLAGVSELILPNYWENISAKTDTFVLRPNWPDGEARKEGPDDEVLKVTQAGSNSIIDAINIAQYPESYFRIALKCCFSSAESVESDQYYAEVFVRPGYKVKMPKDILSLLHLTTNSGGFIVSYQKSLDPIKQKDIENYKFKDFHVIVRHIGKSDEHRLVVKIPHGYYSDAESLFTAIQNNALTAINNSKLFKTDENYTVSLSQLQNKKTRLALSDNLTIEFPSRRPGLGLILGMNGDQIGKPLAGIVHGAHTLDLTGGIHSFFIYSSLIKEQIIGNQSGPLLRILPAGENTVNTYIHKIYNEVDYFELASNTISTIEVLIASDFGDEIQFLQGKTFLQLKFQKVN